MTGSHLASNKLSCLVFFSAWWHFEAAESCSKNAGVSWKYRENLDRQNDYLSCYLTKTLGLTLLLPQWHHGTLYTQKWSRPQLLCSAETWQLQRAQQSWSLVLVLWGRVESKGERNQLLKCHQLSCSTAASTWRWTCMAWLRGWGLLQSQNRVVKFPAVQQLKITKQSVWMLRVSWDTWIALVT